MDEKQKQELVKSITEEIRPQINEFEQYLKGRSENASLISEFFNAIAGHATQAEKDHNASLAFNAAISKAEQSYG